MERRSGATLLVLVLVQACHSVEEFAFRLWDALGPAGYVAHALGLDPALGFALANLLLVGFGLWCWGVPVRRGWAPARAVMRGWAAVEIANGCAHLGLAAAAGAYFPGLFTAPFLIVAAVRLLLVSASFPPGMASAVAVRSNGPEAR